MKAGMYIINSPLFPQKQDFERFGVWCEWHNSEELPYIRALCSSDEEYEELVIRPYEEGKETYYPVVGSNELPGFDFLYVRVTVELARGTHLMGYVSILDNEIVSLSIFPDTPPDDEIVFYRSDRLVSEDEKPLSVDLVVSKYNVEPFSRLQFHSAYKLSNGAEVNGSLEIGRT